MNSVLFALTADDVLGRFNKLCISQQSLMEMFVQDIDDVSIAKDADGSFIDIEKWSIVKLDAKGDVVTINMDIEDIDMGGLFDSDDYDRSITTSCFIEGGTIDFQYVPPTVKTINIEDMDMEGSLETSCLPSCLETLNVYSNKFKGSFDIASLPKDVISIIISANALSGSLSMVCLPPKITTLNAWGNKFSGAVNLIALPPNLEILNLSENKLEGLLELRNVPPALQYVELQGNKFDEEKVILDAKHTMGRFKVDRSYMGKVFDASGNESTQKGIEFPEELCSEESSGLSFGLGFDDCDSDY